MKKTTTLLLIMILFLMNPSVVLGAKKTMTKYTWDNTTGAVATETSSWRSGANFAIFAPSGDIALSSNNTITGNIYAKTLTATNAVVINGNLTLGGTDASFQSVTVNGSVCASGNLTMKQSTVSGDVNAHGNVTMNSGATVNGSVFANGKVALAENPVTVSSAVHAGGNVTIADNCSVNTVCLCSACALTIRGSGKIKSPPATKGSCTAPLKCAAVTTPTATTYDSAKTATVKTINPSSSGTTTTMAPGAYYINLRYENTTLVMKAGSCSKYGDAGCFYLTGFDGGKNNNQTLKLDFSSGGQIVVFSVGDITWSGQVLVSKNGVDYYNIQDYYSSNKTDAEALAKKTYWETHGAFKITSTSWPRHWLGTVLTTGLSTAGNITIVDNTFILGAFASVSGSLSQNNTISIYYVLADYARASW